MMAAEAKYSLLIPKVDNMGNPLTEEIASAAHTYLFYQGLSEGSTITPNQRGMWRDEDPEPHETLTAIMEDNPKHDSIVKQLAVHIAEVANQWGLFVYKEGKDGVQSWIMNNASFRPDQPADPIALADQGLNTEKSSVPSTLASSASN